MGTESNRQKIKKEKKKSDGVDYSYRRKSKLTGRSMDDVVH